MSDAVMIRLSQREAEYIRKLVSEDSSFRDSFLGRPDFRDGRWALILERGEARRMSIYFGLRLARIGFDEDYEPNEEGAMLEALQDKLILW